MSGKSRTVSVFQFSPHIFRHGGEGGGVTVDAAAHTVPESSGKEVGNEGT